MVGAAQGDRATRGAGGGPSRSREPSRARSIRFDPNSGTLGRDRRRPVNVRNADEIERDITAFVRGSNSGLIVLGSGFTIDHRNLIIELAARYKLPTIYPFRVFVTDGGLMSYGHDPIDPHRRAAAYVDRILKGEKPADMPVQAPTKYELAINLKTAKALGITVPSSLLAHADEVLE